MRHHWSEKPDAEKPWHCGCCGLFTANMRHIENGHCRHDWNPSTFGPYRACSRCGVIENAINSNRNCIGTVKVELREANRMTLPKPLSAGEELLALHLRAEGIKFEREVCLIEGRKFRTDFVIRPYRLAIEIDGGSWTQGRHARGAGMASDCEKQNLLVLNGWFPLRFTSEMVKFGQAIQTIREVVGRGK